MGTLNKGLGRGLDALFAAREVGDMEDPVINMLDLSEIQANPEQPRQDFDQEKLDELALSIKSQGIIQPLLVRPHGSAYQIVAGERRWRAAKIAGLTEVPVLIRQMSDSEVMAAALIENLQREDLNPVEEAIALKNLRETMKMTQEELSARIGKSRSAIANALRLLQLGELALEDLKNGRITPGHARCLLAIEDPEARELLRQKILANNLTVRDCEDSVAFWKENRKLPFEVCQETAKEHVAPKTPARRKKDENMREMQSNLSRFLKCRVNMSGSLEKGKITINYANPEALKTLLAIFGFKAAPESPGEEDFS